ncbi:MAG: hypothetical protein ABIH39_00845 [Candidatus Margulisiibacteriota bacterium]
MSNNIYLSSVLEQLPRLLGQINTNKLSSTYGCCDRQYWHNNTVAFPAARYQEAVLTLALLYKNYDTPYMGNQHILDLINACISYWIKIQEQNGSFNEWYPHEGSYVATAFTSYAVSETLLILGKEKIADYDQAVGSLVKSAEWLMSKTEKLVCNQQTGALIALYNTYLLTDNPAFKTAANNYEKIISACQKEEGWFLEYGGADIGYLSLTIDYLAKYHQKTGSSEIEKVINKAIDFIINFIHNDGTAGGVYSSRNTEYLIPHGFELFSDKNENASYIAQNIKRSLEHKKGVSLHSLDDRYLMYIAYTWLQAAIAIKGDMVKTDIDRDCYFFLPESGLYVNRKNGIEVIANLKKTGAFHFSNGSKRIDDSGILINGKRNLFSGYISHNINVVETSEKGFIVEGGFHEVKENLLSPIKNILLYMFQFTIGRIPFLNKPVKTLLRKKMILNQKPVKTMLRRQLMVLDNGIEIKDEIINPPAFNNILVGGKLSFIYVPSSRFFQEENISNESLLIHTPQTLKEENGIAVINRVII